MRCIREGWKRWGSSETEFKDLYLQISRALSGDKNQNREELDPQRAHCVSVDGKKKSVGKTNRKNLCRRKLSP